jgi:putative colanic acid biosynthesis UDP-glucose lipid carrier transferase
MADFKPHAPPPQITQGFDGSMTAPIPISRLLEAGGNRPRSRRRIARVVSSASVDTPTIALVRRFLNPFVAAFSLVMCALLYRQDFTDYLVLAILAFLISTQILSEVQVPVARNEFLASARRRRVFVEWAVVAGMLLLVAFATKLSAEFSRKLILTWFCVTPFLMLAAQAGVRRMLPSFVASAGQRKTALIVGANPLGVEFARRVDQDPYSVKVLGFFDDRALERLPSGVHPRQFLGRLQDLPEFVRRNPVNRIYISLPIVAKPRILKLLHELRDSTASIYFVPDLFAFDLIQARLDEVNGIPVVAVRESPFCGLDGALKRASDVVLATLILLVIWPLLLTLAIGVKLTSPGPIIFKQRRYGLNGEQIVVYKFRSMRVCEDGGDIAQATRNDGRATPLGRFMRRTSFDELPQFINVLQGRMSIVGPRPHAVAHNELYRKLIDGYMLRHKVRPGITGWAQVNGLRGETESIEKMRKRVEYDLDYLRHWSLALDLEIIRRTALTVWRDRRAY